MLNSYELLWADLAVTYTILENRQKMVAYVQSLHVQCISHKLFLDWSETLSDNPLLECLCIDRGVELLLSSVLQIASSSVFKVAPLPSATQEEKTL